MNAVPYYPVSKLNIEWDGRKSPRTSWKKLNFLISSVIVVVITFQRLETGSAFRNAWGCSRASFSSMRLFFILLLKFPPSDQVLFRHGGMNIINFRVLSKVLLHYEELSGIVRAKFNCFEFLLPSCGCANLFLHPGFFSLSFLIIRDC